MMRHTTRPDFYRVTFETVAGMHWRDFPTLSAAQKYAGRSRATVLACWHVEGARHIDSTPVQ